MSEGVKSFDISESEARMYGSIVAIIVTFNRRNLLAKCLRAVLHQEGILCDVLVIDNASTDGTGTYIQNTYGERKDVIYINTGKNLGGAGGFKVGIREAVTRGYTYVWLMDDDTIPERNALVRLLEAGRKLGDQWGFFPVSHIGRMAVSVA